MRRLWIIAFASAASAAISGSPRLLFCCDSTNDLYQAAALLPNSTSANLQRVPLTSCIAAAENLPNGSGVLLLADQAPGVTIVIHEEIFSLLHQRYVRVFAEYAVLAMGSVGWDSFSVSDPWPCPDFTRLVALPGSTLWSERSSTQPFDIFEPNACQYVPYYSSGAPMTSHLALAKVAGFTRAAYGLNGSAPVGVLTTPPQHPGLMLSSLPLSLVRRHRYSPASSWQGLWQDILRWLQFGENGKQSRWTDALTWHPIVRPTFSADAVLSTDRAAETSRAVMASMRWVHTVSELLATPAELETAKAVGLWGPRAQVLGGWPWSLVPVPGNSGSIGSIGSSRNIGSVGSSSSKADGSAGIFEAYLSAVQPRGGGVGGNISTQLHSLVIRTDCIGEAAGVDIREGHVITWHDP
jgi:hypothetical protein